MGVYTIPRLNAETTREKTMKLQTEESVIKRLKRIEGQVRGVIRMIEKRKSCEEILIQIGSVKASMQKTGQAVLENYLFHCVTDGIKKGKVDETVIKLSAAIEQFSRIV
jgi:DNA-binding FrmR family transcriptional regulator